MLIRCYILLVLAMASLQAPADDAAPKPPAWWNVNFFTRKQITIDTSAEGVNLADTVGTQTVLLRLHDGVFNFAGAAEDGSDLRFVADDQKTELPHHIEKWDSLLNEAYVWVKVPDIKGGQKTAIWMYYSVAQPQPAKDTKADRFSADARLVYHFSETGVNADSSSSGVAAENAPPPASSCQIGSGLRVNGQSPVTIPPSPSLAWSAGGSASISVWVKPAALQSKAVVFSRREGNASFILQIDQGIPSVQVSSQTSTGGEPITLNAWHHLVVIAEGDSINLFVDGAPYSTLAAGIPATIGGASLGKDSEGSAAGMAGEIDEFAMFSSALTPGQVKFLYANQGTSPDAAKLVVLGADEAAQVEHVGVIMEHVHLITDISKDLTVDGWVVIGACTLLALVGGFVAVGKVLYLNKIEKASASFLKRWEKLSADLTAIDSAEEGGMGALAAGAKGKSLRLMKQSPLYHIYHLGSEEIQKRLDAAGEKFSGLSGRSIQAIKAALHGGLVREVQHLNSKLVFLTIGIAGGPYLGLLGTVIGVMITFAVIAKSGQVEVNSIAPGIAGALLATVAGLAVAIPCLFAYSYISTRIKDAVSDMETFIDEFIAKMAEHYKETKPAKEPAPIEE